MQVYYFITIYQYYHHRLALEILPNASKMARAGQRVDTSFSSHYYSFAKRKVDENIDPAKFRKLCSAFARGLGCPGVGWAGPGLGVSPAGLLVCALGKYLDPTGDRDRCGPQNPEYGDTKISGDCPRGLSAQGVTSDLATCGPVQDVLAQGIWDKMYHWGSVVGS